MWTHTHCFDFFNVIFCVSVCVKLQTFRIRIYINNCFLNYYLSIMWQNLFITPNVQQHITQTSNYEY